MKPVILAEKPPQARAYADALKPNKKNNGYIEVGPNHIFPKGAIITWAIGHLVGLAEPKAYNPEWEKWSLANMPIKPNSFKYVVSQSKKEHFNIVKGLLKNASEIIVATDCDREGENIARSIIRESKAEDKPIKRLWINSLEVDAIQKGFQNLKDGKEYYLSYIEAQTRQIGDWLVGMNASRLYTLLLRSKGVKESFSVGRVQTPTLFMIYQREKDIENFVPKPFYELEGAVTHSNGGFNVKGNIKVDQKQDALDLLRKHQILLNTPKETTISRVIETVEKESSPRLYTLSTIQTKANKIWKYSPSKVLELVQKLYEKKLVTYPRTDTPYITENEFQYLVGNINHYQEIIGQSFEPINLNAQSRYVNTKKVQEHYAIVPTKNIPSKEEMEKLTIEEKNIYQEIIRNTLAMFHGKYEYSKTIIEIDQNGLLFTATGKVELSKGWKSLYPDESKDHKKSPPSNDSEGELPKVSEGDPVSIKVNVKEGKTTKPKRLTEGELIPLMKNCGNKLEGDEQEILKESEGIGTEATRAGIIETLKNQNYIEVQKNLVYITSKGNILCEVVNGSLLSSPSLTAKWESFLKQIGKGHKKQNVFLEGIEKFIDKMMNEIPSQIESSNVTESIQRQETEAYIGLCPACKKGHILDRNKFYGCTDYKEGCKQTFSKKLLEKNISEAQMKKLLGKGKTDLIKGFKGKSPFDSFLTLEVDQEKNVYKYKFNLAK